jgi:hypothetical protein
MIASALACLSWLIIPVIGWTLAQWLWILLKRKPQ